MLIFSVILVVCYISIQLWQLYIITTYKTGTDVTFDEWPEVSVLVAARNEEKNIEACLAALTALDYPKDKIHILVGNDQSTDTPAELVQKQILSNDNIQLIYIQDDDSGLKAKARVMAQLDKHAKGEFYLITDADVQVNPMWAKSLLGRMTHETGVASGTTMVKENSFYGLMQQCDWTYFMGLLNAISYSGIPATAVGNNMIVRASAYNETGGYSNIRFSITEDYKLYSEICKKGWKWDNVMSPGTLAFSAPVEGFMTLLHQRKRWLSGGKELPWYWWLLFFIFAAYYFVMPVMFYLHWEIAIILFTVKLLCQAIQINGITRHIGQPGFSFLTQILFECYLWIITLCSAIFFLIPLPTSWKGRNYRV